MADKYVVDEVLGSGAMGLVVSATHKLIGQKVAIKFVKSDYLDSDDAIGRFKREARALVAVQSENVVRVLDYGTLQDESPYLVMEYLTGRDLQQELKARGTIPLAEVAEIIVQACEGLAAAHARGIVHRDIKPANLFLTQRANGTRLVKIVDFGISKAPIATEEELSMTRGSIGSPHYMAPEQLRNASRVDARSDVWSLGVTLFRALTGELPFTGDSVAALLAAVASGEPRRLSEERPDLPPEIDAIITRCLHKNPDERFGSAQELADALAPFAMPSARITSTPRVAQAQGQPHADGGVLHESTSKAHVSHVSGNLKASPEWKARLALAVAIGVPLAAVSLALRLTSPGGTGAARSVDAAASASRVVVITDLPAPKSANAEAAAAYQAGLQAVRDGSLVEAMRRFDRAAALDPTMAAAELRGAVHGDWLAGAETRRHARAALSLRASLSESDRELLDAVAPLYISPQPELEDSLRRIDKLVASRPRDTELLFLSARLFLTRRPHAELLKISDRLLELDPHFASALWLRGLVQELELDHTAAMRSVDQCMEISPSAASCLRVRATLEDLQGDCVGLEADAQRMVAMEDGSDRAHDFLARALFALGRPIDSVREALSRKWQACPESTRAATTLTDEAHLAILRGDFAEALKDAEELDRTVRLEGTEKDRAAATLLRIDLDTEVGDVAGAAQVADAHLRRVPVWSTDVIEEDPRPRLYAAAVRGGLRTPQERDQARAEWRTIWDAKIQPYDRPRVWLEGYAAPAETREEAVEALAVLSDYEPMPPLVVTGSTVPAMAKVHALAGRSHEALPELVSVTWSCRALAEPIGVTRAQLQLGQVLEATGDVAGACAAYGAVIDRWGPAKRTATSVTAAAALARVKLLACRR
ncbi:MAG: protein kinase domain-containing protein [Polyangiaceae bacterium]